MWVARVASNQAKSGPKDAAEKVVGRLRETVENKK
jgi:hypothetical protein